LDDGETVELGNTVVTAVATPGHAPAHHAYSVADRRRGSKDAWLVFTGDSLLVGDVGRPDLHVAGDAEGQARVLHASLRRLLGLPANAGQFALLVGLNAVVGAMVGLERSVFPLIGKRDFGVHSTSAILAFVVAFGAAKALTNLAAGSLAERAGRKRLLVAGWL